MTLIGVVLPNEFKERVPLGHRGAVLVAGTIVDADPSINRIDISAIAQERIHRSVEQVATPTGGNRERDIGINRR
ncbi:unannotated protein [freshwater metagenome]|uniref:Unannotated protein n=1 Tax=freshwater metagenome TaxID=449393 RepID=A0A6J6DUA2_9ZZZZ